jgi:hypothetical protein
MELETFIQFSNASTTIKELVQLFSAALRPFNYTHFICFTENGPVPDVIDEEPHYHSALLQQYNAAYCLSIDPVYALLVSTREPFTWDQVSSLDLSPMQRDVMSLRRSTGLIKGFSIPIHGPDRELIGISLASEDDEALTDHDSLAKMYMLANQFCLRRAELIQATKLRNLAPLSHLHLIAPDQNHRDKP